jgi:hypothetical protein
VSYGTSTYFLVFDAAQDDNLNESDQGVDAMFVESTEWLEPSMAK